MTVHTPNQARPDHVDADAANSVLVEVTRGDMVESRHRASVAVVNAARETVLAAGDLARPVYARSAIKPLQALALVESGAADAFELSDAEIALACASHNGEPRHVETVKAWLERIGCSVEDLECGAHAPFHEPSAAALWATGVSPDAAYNNCSGKHAGFLSVARHLGYPTAGYIQLDHPVQQLVLNKLATMTGLDLSEAPRGIDGCGIPVIGMPLPAIAFAMAHLAAPADQSKERQAACARIRHAMAAEPFMVAGTGRFCTEVMEAVGDKALVKTGAEGFFCAALPELGLGIALKVDDGEKRAAEVLMAHLLRRLKIIDDDQAERLREVLAPAVRNRAGAITGGIRIVADAAI